MFNTLVIIGNGFDLAHGYNTTFDSFSNKFISDSNILQFKQYHKELLPDNLLEEQHTKWYDFENVIEKLTRSLYGPGNITNKTIKNTIPIIDNLNIIFDNIHAILIEYLKEETAVENFKMFSTIKDYSTPQTNVINFNYTNTAKKYFDNIFYVHGSIEENDIILGYDSRDEFCLSQYRDILWSKQIKRKELAFRRYVEYEKHIPKDSPEYKKLVLELNQYQKYSNSSRGFDKEIIMSIPNFDFINLFMSSEYSKYILPNIDYSHISTIVVIGHGLKADEKLLKDIINKCSSVEKIILFQYDGETEQSIEEKKCFFGPWNIEIDIKKYC